MFQRFKSWKRRHQIAFGLLLGAAVISFWRGIWGLLDVFLFPGSSVASYTASIAIGIAIIWLAHYVIEG